MKLTLDAAPDENPHRQRARRMRGAEGTSLAMRGLAVVGLALAVAACGGTQGAAPKPSDVRADLDLHGIDLRTRTVDDHGCVIMQPRATNTGAVRTYGEFALVIATRDSCNDIQATGSADGERLYWSRHGDRWFAKQKLQSHLWLRMVVPRHELGEQQHALQTAALHAFHSRN